MNIQLFLEDIRGSEPIKGLEKFVYAIEHEGNASETIIKLLEKSSNCDDILQIFSKKKCTQAELSIIFNSLGYILISIASDLLKYQEVGIHITRWVLQNQAQNLLSHLNISNTVKNITSSLHCITGMVMIGSASANEVITHLDFNRINFQVLVERIDHSSSSCISTWVLCLFLAFLNLRDSRCLRQLLQVEGAISSVFKGLKDYPADKIFKFLNLLHEVVVLNMNISKTLKVKVFNTQSCSNLMLLYNYGNNFDLTIDEKAKVQKAIHQLMMTLFTDFNHGIIFRGKPDSQNNEMKTCYNRHILFILKSGKCIWDSEEGLELVACTLKVCPDITKMFMQSFHSLEPKSNDSYFSLMKLFAVIISKNEPWSNIKVNPKKEISMDSISFLIYGISNKILIELITGSSELVVHCGLIMLNTLYSKVKETLSKINDLEELTNEEKVHYKKIILKKSESLGGGRNKLFSCWNRLFSGELRKEVHMYPAYIENHATHFAVLALTAKVYEQYGELFGFKLLRSRINPFNILENVCKSSDSLIEKDAKSYQILLRNVLNFLQIAQRSNDFEFFGYNKDVNVQNDSIILNKQWFMLLLDIYCRINSQKYSEYGPVIENICLDLINSAFRRWGLSSHCPIYFHIWLNKLGFFDKQKCSQFLVEIITNTVSNLFAYLEVLMNINSTTKKNSNIDFDILTVINNATPSSMKDNVEVENELTIPFSCIVVGATEILKLDAEQVNIDYFSSVMSDYINFLDDPRSLAKFLLSNKVVSSEMNLYLNSLLNGIHIDVEVVEYQNLSIQLKNIFMSKKYPSVSEFCASFKLIGNMEIEIISLCRQLILYIQVESESIVKEKRKFKFYWKVLKGLITQFDNGEKTFSFSGVYQCLLEHPFIIESYKPLLNSDYINSEIKMILGKVVASYPKLHFLIRPFITKIVKYLQNLSIEAVETIDFVSNINIFSSKSSIINLDDIQSMITFCLPFKSVDSVDKLFCYLLQLLVNISNSQIIELSQQNLISLFHKLLHHNSGSSELDRNISNLLSKLLVKTIDNHIVASLTQDDLKRLASGNHFNAALCSKIIELHPPNASVITKQLKKSAIDLKLQGSYILMHINLEKDNKYLGAYFWKIKEAMLHWAYDFESETNSVNEMLLCHMLQKEIFDLPELQSLCDHLYNQVIELKKYPPKHSMNLSPIFKFVSDSNINAISNTSLSPNLQLLCIILSVVSKYYGKAEDTAIFTKVSTEIIKLISIVDKLSIKSELESTFKIWNNFVKKVLKHSISDVNNGPQLLECLTSLIKIVYVKPFNKLVLPLSTIHQMLHAHSEFIDMWLSQEDNIAKLKEKTINLIQTIVEIDSESCEEKHVPLFLSGYGASKSLCDQAILKLLFWYERNGFMKTYTPTIWGKFALSYFAVEKGPGKMLHYSNPRHQNIFALLDKEKVIETALNFDMNLHLEPETSGLVSCDASIGLYDQRFLLMLFLHVTEEEPTMSILDMVEKGVVALGISALSSKSEEVWAAGSTILKNVVLLLRQSGYINIKLQWMWLIAVLGYGFESKRSRLPSLIVHFLIRTSQLLFNPEDIMYKVVLNYLYLKPALSFAKVPEFFVLFFSEHCEHHKEHRSFLLDILHLGIRDELDVQVFQNSYAPKFILSLLTSPTVNFHIKIKAIGVLKSLVSISEGASLMVNEYGLLTQLPLALKPTTLCPAKHLDAILDAVLEVLTSLRDTWKMQTDSSLEANSNPAPVKCPGSNKRKKAPTENGDLSANPHKKQKNIGGTAAGMHEEISTKKNKNYIPCHLSEYATCLSNISYAFSVGSSERKSRFGNLCKEIPCFDKFKIQFGQNILI